jgi:hypothetical protein
MKQCKPDNSRARSICRPGHLGEILWGIYSWASELRLCIGITPSTNYNEEMLACAQHKQ